MKTKHKMARLINGGYNYRGYCMYRMMRSSKVMWVVRNHEEERDWAAAPTLEAMRRIIDRRERAAEKGASA